MKFCFPNVRQIFFLLVIGFSFAGCSSSTNIDDYYTFNVGKSQTITVPSQVPVGQDVTVPFVLVIDSVDLVSSKTLSTTIPLTKSVKLTKLTFSSSDNAYQMTSFDSLTLIVSCDSLPDQILATYSGTSDVILLTNADFAAYLKQQSCHYTISFRANAAPSQSVDFTAQDELVFTAKPQP
ncbi:MAG: hypothetical protein ABI778_05820 [Ignavibacteriota bacterium]